MELDWDRRGDRISYQGTGGPAEGWHGDCASHAGGGDSGVREAGMSSQGNAQRASGCGDVQLEHGGAGLPAPAHPGAAPAASGAVPPTATGSTAAGCCSRFVTAAPVFMTGASDSEAPAAGIAAGTGGWYHQWATAGFPMWCATTGASPVSVAGSAPSTRALGVAVAGERAWGTGGP